MFSHPHGALSCLMHGKRQRFSQLSNNSLCSRVYSHATRAAARLSDLKGWKSLANCSPGWHNGKAVMFSRNITNRLFFQVKNCIEKLLQQNCFSMGLTDGEPVARWRLHRMSVAGRGIEQAYSSPRLALLSLGKPSFHAHLIKLFKLDWFLKYILKNGNDK